MPTLIQIQPSDLGFCWPIQYFKNNIGFIVTFKNQEISLKKFLYLLKYQKVSQHQASILTCKKKKKKIKWDKEWFYLSDMHALSSSSHSFLKSSWNWRVYQLPSIMKLVLLFSLINPRWKETTAYITWKVRKWKTERVRCFQNKKREHFCLFFCRRT